MHFEAKKDIFKGEQFFPVVESLLNEIVQLYLVVKFVNNWF